jgi:6-phosphogluconolactonase (cycloisomerase 2 family)
LARETEALTVEHEIVGGAGLTPAFSQPQAIVVSKSSKYVYVASYLDSAIHVFEHDQMGKKFRRVQCIQGNECRNSDPLASKCDHLNRMSCEWLCFHPNEQLLFAGDGSSSAVVIFKCDLMDGSLTPLNRRDTIREVASTTYCATFSPDGKRLYVCGTTGTIAAFSCDELTGNMTLVQRLLDPTVVIPSDSRYDTKVSARVRVDELPGLSIPRAILSSADGRFLYVASFEDRSISVLQVGKDNGYLERRWQVGDKDSRLVLFPDSIASSADNSHVVIGTSGNGGVVFDRDRRTGKLIFKQRVSDPRIASGDPTGLESVAWLGDQRFFIGASADEHKLLLFKNSVESGAFQWKASLSWKIQDRVHGSGDSIPSRLAASANGRFVYTIFPAHDTLQVIKVDPAHFGDEGEKRVRNQ